MTTLVRLVSEYYIWLMGACVLGILFYIGRAIAAHREKSRAIFTIEREAAASTRLRSIGMGFLLLVVAAILYFTVTYLEPNLVLVAENEATPTVPILLEPTPSPTLGLPTPTFTPRPTRTPRPTSTPEASPIPPTPTPPSVVLPDCPNPQARLTNPTVNAVLKGTVEIRGSANVDEFQFYKFEIKGEATSGEWRTIATNDTPVADGFLGIWDTSALPAGNYRFRLVVVKKDGNYPEPCEVPVTIEH